MKLIVGLGNVGDKYQNTRHNLGFGIIDLVAIGFGKQPSDFSQHSKASANVLDLKSSHECILVKPTTMMNLSGQAVGELARFYKIDSSDIWVAYDDVDMAFGQVRIRKGGPTGGGHNGVKSVIAHVGEDFWRIRVGIANEFLKTTPTDKFVLDKFSAEEASKIPDILRIVAEIIENAVDSGNLSDQTVKPSI